jgi:DnaD/phage-associated family protein
MSGTIKLFGFDNEIRLPSHVITNLSSRGLKLYAHLLDRRQNGPGDMPGIDELASVLSSEIESWSEPTVKRAMGELVLKRYAYRQRRFKETSITYVLKDPADYDKLLSQITDDPACQITDDPTITTISIFAMWEQETGQMLTPTIRDDLGGMIDEHGEKMVREAIQEAARSAKGRFNLNYLYAILSNWSQFGREKPPQKKQSADPLDGIPGLTEDLEEYYASQNR